MSAHALTTRLVDRFSGRLGFLGLTLIYALLVAACLGTLAREDELSLGRNPVANLVKTVGEFAHPSFLDIWFGNPNLQYKSDDGTVLRVENRQQVEADYLAGLGRATWTTIRIATLGSLLGALLALPLAVLTARNLSAPKPLAWLTKGILDVARSIHTLVFGLVLVGIVGLGPTAGILAIGLHSMGTYGKLFAEAIESLDMAAIDAVRSVGATPDQVFFNAIWPSVLPQFVSSHLYVWEFNIRDSTILGLIGAGGLGLLITEATSLFQWGQLSTVLIVIVLMVSAFDTLSQRIRQAPVMNEISISLQKVCCIADGRALLDVGALTIRHGERIAIVGHNGAGKSTLLRLLTGFMPAAHGTVEVLGRNLADSPSAQELRTLRRNVGQIHQGLHLVTRLSALENVLIGSLGRVVGWRSWVRHFPTAEVAEAEAALHAVGLLARAKTRADKLSGGERQKVAIARLLVQQPKLILADEPTAALDPTAASEVCHLLAQAARNATLISVVHNPSLLPLLADRIIGLKKGRIAFDLPIAAVNDQKLTNLYRPDEAAPAAPWQLPKSTQCSVYS